jgi:hypothetical protein
LFSVNGWFWQRVKATRLRVDNHASLRAKGAWDRRCGCRPDIAKRGNTMKRLIVLIALAGLSVPALADTAQQEKMKSCNAEAKAKGLKGDAYKKFRDDCLKAKPEAATTTAKPEAATTTTAESKKLTPQQEKMKSCNGLASSQGLTGDARKKFMSSCLKG